MNILFVGKACPLKTAQNILQQSGKNPGYQIIKFMDLLLKGFIFNKQEVSVITNISNSSKFYSPLKTEKENGVYYKYLPTIHFHIISQLCHYFFSFLYTLLWSIKTRGDKIILCDVIASSSSCSGSFFAAKLCGVKTCMLLTDMITFPVTTSLNIKNWWWKIFLRLRVLNQQKALRKYDAFIFLTKQMNDIYNPLNKPFIIMEGSVDHTFVTKTNVEKREVPTIMYAGVIDALYGFNELVQAFMTLSIPNIELHIYGSGKFVNQLLEYQKQDPRIKYKGIISNEQVVEEEQRATLLVNPRLSHHEFVKYSFPSKTSEYMLSGTPLLTTKLAGIPDEYLEHLYLFEEETKEGFAQTLQEVLSLSSEELHQKGLAAQKFVLTQKNNIIQTKRIINLLKKIIQQ